MDEVDDRLHQLDDTGQMELPSRVRLGVFEEPLGSRVQ